MITNRPFPHFQQTITLNQGQGGQKYIKCMKMSTPTSLWCYCTYALTWKYAGKVYFCNINGLICFGDLSVKLCLLGGTSIYRLVIQMGEQKIAFKRNAD